MFQGLFKFIFGLIRLALFLVLLAVIFHTWVIKQAITLSLSYQLGADVSVQGVKMDWKNTGFEVQGLEIGNPYSFPRGTLAYIPLVIASVDLPSIPQGVVRIKTLGIDLREIQVMNASQKGLNILALKPLQQGDEEHSSSPSKEAVRAQIRKYTPKVMIDELIFSIGDIRYLDMSGPALKQNNYKAGIRGATYYNIEGTKDVVVIVVTETLKKMGFAYLGTQLQKLRDRYASAEGTKANLWTRALAALGGKSSE
jgi:hypothetical protein